MTIPRTLAFAACALLVSVPLTAQGTTYYVSAQKGKGKKGSKEEPVRDLAILVPALQPGDTVMIAGGTYTGRGDCGSDKIAVTCSIVGGWNDDFTARDPWGSTRTILTGDNKSKNWNFNARLWIDCRGQKTPGNIVVDGVIVDNGPRNQFAKDEGLKIVRKFNAATGANATPESPGIFVDTPRGGTATITNCIVMNTAPTGGTGAIYAFGCENSKLTITNNLVINNTGTGINCVSSWHPRDGKGYPQFTVADNTVLFSWKYDPYATHGGSSLKMDSDTIVTATGNVFAFNDYYDVDNVKQSKGMTLKDNLFGPALVGEYNEFNTVVAAGKLDEEAQLLTAESTGNVAGKVELQLDEKWAASFAARTVIDRNKAEAGVTADGWQNELRSMLGLNKQGSTVTADSDVWLHRMSIDDAVKAGMQKQQVKYGCQNPSNAAAATPGK
ncbi:MAG: right-handed parallel beta-helix repeat-containing protein [Planctomycetota bacterium]